MKQLITLMALMLIAKNGKTTNKDIKEGLRLQFKDDPDFRLVQADVHLAMNEIALAQGLEFDLGYSVEGHEYRIWRLPAPQGSTPDTADSAADTSDSSLLAMTHQALQVDPDGSLKTATAAPVGFGPQADPTLGEIVGYMKQDPSSFVQGNDKKTVRRETYGMFHGSHPGSTYDDVRICSLTHYNKNVAGR